MILKTCSALLAVCLLTAFALAADKPVTDDHLIDQVRIKLAADMEVKGGALLVDSKQGVVTISGSVETQHQKDKATRIAKKVKGVKQVINNITLKEKTAGK